MKRCVLALLSGLFAFAAAGRVISYAPYTDRTTVTAFHHRDTRHFLTIELTNPIWDRASLWEVVLYDSTGSDEPRVVHASATRVHWAAMWEDERHLPAILIARDQEILFSNDGGRVFTKTALPATTDTRGGTLAYGGPFTGGRYAPVRIGSAEFPFVVYDTAGAVWRVASNGIATKWVPAPAQSSNAILGSDVTRSRFLIRFDAKNYIIASPDGTTSQPAPLPEVDKLHGWITPEGRVYFETPGGLWEGTTRILAARFAIPTHDYSGAWIIEPTTAGTRLLRHTAKAGLEEMFLDPRFVLNYWNEPGIEALHAGASGNTLLIQATDLRFASWRLGEPPPKELDRLYLLSRIARGFIHVDPDRFAAGAPFVFDSGNPVASTTVRNTPEDTLYDSGMVRGSLKQQLVLPAAGRALGAYGSNWTTDLTLYNPLDVPQKVELRFVQSGPLTEIDTKDVTLNAKEIRLLPDLLGTMFGRVGSGALFLTPESHISAASRTYTRAGTGSFGFGMNAIDVVNGSSPRLPVTFAGAFPGSHFRTNVTLTDLSGRGSSVSFAASAAPDPAGPREMVVGVPSAGQRQINNVETELGIPGLASGLVVRAQQGFVVPSVFAIDNRTNDPTYFPPDVSSTRPRWIAVIGHVDGANGARFRTDLYLYNTSPQKRTVYLMARPWNTSEDAGGSLLVELDGHESRVIRDAYFTFFGKTGVGRLRYYSSNPQSGIRVTARTYSMDGSGGTYGHLTPPVSGHEIVTSSSLEILVNGGKGSRTNLGIVEMSFEPQPRLAPATARVEIIDPAGRTIDDFTVSFPIAGGMQIDDVFRSRGHGDGPAAALIRVTPEHGSITAFATITDNTTNDSVYLAPYLAAR